MAKNCLPLWIYMPTWIKVEIWVFNSKQVFILPCSLIQTAIGPLNEMLIDFTIFPLDNSMPQAPNRFDHNPSLLIKWREFSGSPCVPNLLLQLKYMEAGMTLRSVMKLKFVSHTPNFSITYVEQRKIKKFIINCILFSWDKYLIINVIIYNLYGIF